jgi:hypothetical protein
MPASISSKTIVSPPPTAAIASAIRESSPPEAVSATGANGRPALGRIRNATSSAACGPVALAQLDAELAVAEADAAQLRGDRRGERVGRLRGARRAARRRARRPLLGLGERWPRRPTGRSRPRAPSSALASAARASSSS